MPAHADSRLRQRAIAQAWRSGFLAWKLDRNQLRAYRKIRGKIGSEKFARYLLNWARRTGKTFVLLLIACEDSIQKPRSRWVVASTTKEQLAEIVWPMLEALLEDCPEEFKPKLDEHKKRVTFRNGSRIVFGSCESKRSVERMRGPKADGIIIEEAGTIPDSPGLEYVMTSVLKPQLRTTGGPLLMAMTPPESSGHESVTYLANARAAGNYDHCTFYDNPRESEDTRNAYMRSDAEDLGMTPEEYLESIHYRREWLAQILTDPEKAVLPGATERAMAEIVKPPEARILFSDRYVAMDVGWAPDFTGVLFGYWDFERQILVIEHELMMRRMNTLELASAIKAAEEKLWGAHDVYLRVSDTAPILIEDLGTMHGLTFIPTEKDDRDAAIAATDVWVRKRKMQIVPYDEATGLGCRHLPEQMKAAIWNNHRTEFGRSKQFGHFDLVAALVYLVRNVRKNAGRIPEGWGVRHDTWVSPKAAEAAASPTVSNLRKLVRR